MEDEVAVPGRRRALRVEASGLCFTAKAAFGASACPLDRLLQQRRNQQISISVVSRSRSNRFLLQLPNIPVRNEPAFGRLFRKRPRAAFRIFQPAERIVNTLKGLQERQWIMLSLV